MIITCQSCNTKYSINKKSIGKNGKKVRCSNCGYEWYQKLDITKKRFPAVNIAEGEKSFQVSMAAPGLTKSDFITFQVYYNQ